jgi:hypothetical protein
LPGLYLAGERVGLGGSGKLRADNLSVDEEAVEGDWMGRTRLSPLESDASRCRPDGLEVEFSSSSCRSIRLHLAAARVAGATENRRPICTVALLLTLELRLCFLPKRGAGLDRKLKASLTSVMDLASPSELRRN